MRCICSLMAIMATALAATGVLAQPTPPLAELAPKGSIRVAIAISPAPSALYAIKAADGSYKGVTVDLAPGQFILYPGGISETEILLAYGGAHFASKMGQLAGNHFITITEGLENLYTLGRTVLWEGAQPIRFELG